MLHKIFNKKERETAPQMLFSQNISLSMDTRATRRNCNALVTGANQHYRNAHYVLPNLAQPTGSYVILDDTDEELTIQDMTEQTFRDHGYEIKVFDIRHPEKSLKYNPFNYIRDDADILTMVDTMSQNFLGNSIVSQDSEFSKARQALLQSVAFYLFQDCNPEDRTLANILKLLDCARNANEYDDSQSILDIMMSDLKTKNPEHPAVKCYDSFREFRKASPDDAKKVIIDLLVNLTVFKLNSINSLTSSDQLDLSSIGLKPTVLYIKYPRANSTYSELLVPILITQLFDTLYHTAETACARATLPIHARIFLNNFGAYGAIPELTGGYKMATMRPYNISCDILTDDLEAIKRDYPDDWKYIIGNCDTLVHFPTPGGPPKHFEKHISCEDPQTPGAVKRIIKRCPATIKKGAEPILTPEQMANLKPGDCAVILRGCVPLADKVLDAPSNYPKCPT